MRLIDAEVLRNNVREIKEIQKENWIPGYLALMKMIDLSPPVIAAPVAIGKWCKSYKSTVTTFTGHVCSICDRWSKRRSNFCPNCGAKMEGE